MSEKTPRFNEKIKGRLSGAVSGERICQATGKKFVIRPEDVEFYKSINVPLPVFCPEERWYRVMAHCPSKEFFMRKSDLSGKETASNIDPECPLKVYANDEWWSDRFDAAVYGREADPKKSFFGQWHELQLDVPRPALYSAKPPVGNNELSLVLESDNCYRAIGGPNLERVYFCNGCMNSRDSAELFLTNDCELCYQLFECVRCYDSAFLDTCANCVNCYFGYDLRNCEFCFGCNNLRHKKYCFFNEQLTKEEYEKKLSKINLGSRREQEHWLALWEKTLSDAYRLNLYAKGVENCFGSYIFDSKDGHNCIECTKSQNVAYTFYIDSSRDVFDSYSIVGSERVVSSSIIIASYDVYYSYSVLYSSQVEYSEFCLNTHNCFGCVGLRNKKFHIFNKPYSEDEYWRKVDEIKTAMLERGEYGSTLPLKYTAYAYNLCLANNLFPLTKEQAEEKGIHWYELPLATMPEALRENDIPDDIRDTGDDIVGKPIACRETNRLYSVVKAELDFYRRINAPVPASFHWQRWAARHFNSRSVYFIASQCRNCGKGIVTQKYKNRKEKVVCKECYDKLVEQY